MLLAAAYLDEGCGRRSRSGVGLTSAAGAFRTFTPFWAWAVAFTTAFPRRACPIGPLAAAGARSARTSWSAFRECTQLGLLLVGQNLVQLFANFALQQFELFLLFGCQSQPLNEHRRQDLSRTEPATATGLESRATLALTFRTGLTLASPFRTGLTLASPFGTYAFRLIACGRLSNGESPDEQEGCCQPRQHREDHLHFRIPNGCGG
jgi:hypothetical protein